MGVEDLMTEAGELVAALSPPEVAADVAAGAVLIDTRCHNDRGNEGVVPGSVHHPRSVLEWRMDPDSAWRDPAIADPSLRHIIMCNDGYSSLLAAANLHRMGFTAIAHLVGGFRAWKAAGLPVSAEGQAI